MHRRRFRFGVVASLLAAVVLAAVFASSALSSSAVHAKAQAKFTPVKANTLTVDAYVPFTGYWNGTSPSHLTGGLEYKIAQALQKKFHLAHLVVRTVNFTALTAGILTGYDIAMADIYPTPQRAKVNKYSVCYDPSATVAVVKKGTPLKTLAEAKALDWGVELGSAPSYVIENGVKPTTTPRVFQDTAAMMPLLLTGSINAVANSVTDVAKYLKEPAYKDYYIPAQLKYNSPQTDNQCGAIQLPKKSTNLPAVNAALKALIKSGQIKKWREKYVIPTFDGINPYKLPTLKIP